MKGETYMDKVLKTSIKNVNNDKTRWKKQTVQ
jgi:hypothetical protein